jgi:oxygen-dependent protoporphyrinogen oxidase
MTDSEILESAQKELAPLLGIKSAPVFSILKRYPSAMPQYRVGHLELVDRIRAEISKHRGLELAGNAYGGVGIPDCVNSGEQAAEKLFQTIHGEML